MKRGKSREVKGEREGGREGRTSEPRGRGEERLESEGPGHESGRTTWDQFCHQDLSDANFTCFASVKKNKINCI